MNIRKIVVFSSLVLSPFVSAGEWSSHGTISGFYVDLRATTERILFRLSEPRSDSACANSSNYYELKMGSSRGKDAYSYLLSLEATKKQVRLYIEGCGATGFPLVVVVDSLD